MPAIDVENAWGLDATSYGNHEFDYGVERLLRHQARANFPFLATNIVETATGQRPTGSTPSAVFTVNGIEGRRHRRRAAEHAGARLRRGDRRPDVPRRGAAHQGRVRAAPHGRRAVQVVVIHQGTNVRGEPDRQRRRRRLGRADSRHRRRARGHDRRRDDRRSHPPHLEPDARATSSSPRASTPATSYSVLQLMVKGGDVAWAGGATRIAKNIGVAERADVKAIVDDANAETAVLRNQVIGTQINDITARPDPAPRVGDGQPRRRLDAGEVPRRRRGVHELGRSPCRTSSSPRRARGSSPARSPGARSSPSCRSATGRRSSR